MIRSISSFVAAFGLVAMVAGSPSVASQVKGQAVVAATATTPKTVGQHASYVGTISEVAAGRLQLKTSTGRIEVVIVQRTIIQNSAGTPMAASALRLGEKVTVDAHWLSPDRVEALSIRELPAPILKVAPPVTTSRPVLPSRIAPPSGIGEPNQREPYDGLITEVAAGRLQFTVHDRRPFEVVLLPSTVIIDRQGNRLGLNVLRANERAIVVGHWLSPDRVEAWTILVE